MVENRLKSTEISVFMMFQIFCSLQ